MADEYPVSILVIPLVSEAVSTPDDLTDSTLFLRCVDVAVDLSLHHPDV